MVLMLLHHFAALTGLAVEAPCGDISGHSFPDPSRGYHPPGSPDSRVCQTVDSIEDCHAVRQWDNGTKRASRCVAEEGFSTDFDVLNVEQCGLS